VVRTISQRGLRNDNAEIVRGVEAGETYTLTRRGVSVARIVGPSEGADLRCINPARKRPRYATQQRVEASTSTSELLEDLRGER